LFGGVWGILFFIFFVVEGGGSEREEVFLFFGCLFSFHCIFNHTKGPISVITFREIYWNVGDREFDRLSGQIKAYEDGICCSEPAISNSS
jgi:hypothetical protein